MAADRQRGPASAAHDLPGTEQPFLEHLAERYRSALNRFFATRSRSDPIEQLDGYIFQTASSVLTDRARRRAVRKSDQHVMYEEREHAIEDFSPERVLLARELVAMVRTVLERLPERVRAAFVLHRFEELGYAEIAKRLGVSVSSIEKYISQALRELTAARMRDEL